MVVSGRPRRAGDSRRASAASGALSLKGFHSGKGSLCVVELEDLIFMKLLARRRQELLGIVDLLKCGGNPGKIRRYLEQNGPGLLPTFEELLVEAGSG